MSGLASVFPPPPPYYKKYTIDADLTVIELRPPSPPDPLQQQTYRNYGSIWTMKEIIPKLESSGIAQLFKLSDNTTTTEIVSELKRLLKLVLLQYLGLLQTLNSDSTQFPSSLESLRTLFINIHHLLNTYRPLQTMESLVHKIENQINAARQSADLMRKTNEQITKQISALEAALPTGPINIRVSGEHQDKTWEGLDLDIDFQMSEENEMAVE